MDQIFGYLDYYCLRRAELVSVVWQEALLEGKIWKTLLGRNVSRLMAVIIMLYQTICYRHNFAIYLDVSLSMLEGYVCCLERNEA